MCPAVRAVHVHRLIIARSHPKFHHHFVYPPHRTGLPVHHGVRQQGEERARRVRNKASIGCAASHRAGAYTRSRSAGHDSFGGLRAAHERHGAPARVAQQAGSPALPEGAGAPDLRVNARTGHGDQTRSGRWRCHLSTPVHSVHSRAVFSTRAASRQYAGGCVLMTG